SRMEFRSASFGCRISCGQGWVKCASADDSLGGSRMNFINLTHLDSSRLESLFRHFAGPWPLDGLKVRVRYTRSAPFSGSCRYGTAELLINIGRRNKYPYALKTYVAHCQTVTRGRERYWSRPLYVVYLQDAYQLALFLFMHELYHWLVRRARRNTRQ